MLNTQIMHMASARNIPGKRPEIVEEDNKSVISKTTEREIVDKFTQQCLRRLGIRDYARKHSIGVSTIMLYKLFEIWCEIWKISCIPQKTFTIQMRQLGYRKDRGKCLVKSFVYDEPADKQQIFFHNVPGIADPELLEQVKHEIHEKLTDWECKPSAGEYRLLQALEVWLNEKNNCEALE